MSVSVSVSARARARVRVLVRVCTCVYVRVRVRACMRACMAILPGACCYRVSAGARCQYSVTE